MLFVKAVLLVSLFPVPLTIIPMPIHDGPISPQYVVVSIDPKAFLVAWKRSWCDGRSEVIDQVVLVPINLNACAKTPSTSQWAILSVRRLWFPVMWKAGLMVLAA